MAQVRLAEEYRYGPLIALNNHTFTIAKVGAGDRFDATAYVPTQDEIGDSPEVDLCFSFLVPNGNAALSICVGLAPPGLLATADVLSAYHRRGIAIGWGLVYITGVLPRLDAASTTLLDGNAVYLVNLDTVAGYTVYMTSFVPTLNLLVA